MKQKGESIEFTDALEVGYGAVVHSGRSRADGSCGVKILLGRNRALTLKSTLVPILELKGYMFGSKDVADCRVVG